MEFLQYNDHLNLIEEVQRHEIVFRPPRPGGRIRARYEEIHNLQPRPTRIAKNFEDIHLVSRYVDPLHGVTGKPGKIGSYISLKSHPSVTHICIKHGVQNRALSLLAERLIFESRTHPARILIKKRRKKNKPSSSRNEK